MPARVVPMIHVPDVRSTVEWYQNIGFTVIETYGDDSDGLSFAVLSFGSSKVMFNSGGRTDTRHRRDVDLYVYTDNVDGLYQKLKDRVDIVEGPHDTFYGMREITVRDLNRFWITFGQTSAYELLMTGVQEGNAELVGAALKVARDQGGLKPATLTAALAIASAADTMSGDTKNAGIQDMLREAGAIPAAQVNPAILQSYSGKYKGEQGFEINVTFEGGKLFAAIGAQPPLVLMAVDETTFKPLAFDGYGSVTFSVAGGEAVGCALKHGGTTVQLKRVLPNFDLG